MRHTAILGLLGMVGMIAPAATAAEFRTYSGTNCYPTQSTALVTYDQYGVRPNNFQDLPLDMVCPVPALPKPLGTSDQPRIQMNVYDRNSIHDVSCTVLFTNVSGSVTYSQTLQTTGAKEGLTSLLFTPTISPGGVFWANAFCTVPGLAGTASPFTNWPSHITTYSLSSP